MRRTFSRSCVVPNDFVRKEVVDDAKALFRKSLQAPHSVRTKPLWRSQSFNLSAMTMKDWETLWQEWQCHVLKSRVIPKLATDAASLDMCGVQHFSVVDGSPLPPQVRNSIRQQVDAFAKRCDSTTAEKKLAMILSTCPLWLARSSEEAFLPHEVVRSVSSHPDFERFPGVVAAARFAAKNKIDVSATTPEARSRMLSDRVLHEMMQMRQVRHTLPIESGVVNLFVNLAALRHEHREQLYRTIPLRRDNASRDNVEVNAEMKDDQADGGARSRFHQFSPTRQIIFEDGCFRQCNESSLNNLLRLRSSKSHASMMWMPLSEIIQFHQDVAGNLVAHPDDLDALRLYAACLSNVVKANDADGIKSLAGMDTQIASQVQTYMSRCLAFSTPTLTRIGETQSCYVVPWVSQRVINGKTITIQKKIQSEHYVPFTYLL